MTKTPTQSEKKIDVNKVVNYLNNAFATALEKMERGVRDPQTGVTNKTYELQVDFSYLIDDIQRGPECLMTHHIAKTNELIDSINQKKKGD